MQDNLTSKRWGGWYWLAPIVGLFVQFAACAQETIAHQQFATPNPNPLLPWDFQGQRVLGGPTVTVQWGLDMNGDGQPDFTFVSHEGESFAVVPTGNNAVLSYTLGHGGIDAWAIPLASLARISADSGDYTWVHRMDSPFPSIPDKGSNFVGYNSEFSIGSFLGVESAYIGLQFLLDDGVHYGWARVGCPLTGQAGGWIYEAAYDIRPNTPILAGARGDIDKDGVEDGVDQCSGTPLGEVVNTNGCSISQLVPCDGPWKNHGEYVARVIATVAQFQRQRLITKAEARVIVKEAARSDCGKQRALREHHGRIDCER